MLVARDSLKRLGVVATLRPRVKALNQIVTFTSEPPETDGPGHKGHRKNIIELGADVDRKFNLGGNSRSVKQL